MYVFTSIHIYKNEWAHASTSMSACTHTHSMVFVCWNVLNVGQDCIKLFRYQNRSSPWCFCTHESHVSWYLGWGPHWSCWHGWRRYQMIWRESDYHYLMKAPMMWRKNGISDRKFIIRIYFQALGKTYHAQPLIRTDIQLKHIKP